MPLESLMKLPFIVVVIALVIVGFLFAKSAAAVIRFSANVLTWILILAIVIGAAWMLQNSKSKDDMQPVLESKKNDLQWR